MIKQINNDLGGSTSTEWFFVYLVPGRIRNCKKMDFEEKENRSTRRNTCTEEQGREPTTHSTYIWCPCRIFEHRTHSVVGGECSHHRANPCSLSLGWATLLSWSQLVEEKKLPLTRNRATIQPKKFNDTI